MLSILQPVKLRCRTDGSRSLDSRSREEGVRWMLSESSSVCKLLRLLRCIRQGPLVRRQPKFRETAGNETGRQDKKEHGSVRVSSA